MDLEQRMDTAFEDTAWEGRRGERDRQNETDSNKWGGHAQDTARDHQRGPPQNRTWTPPRRSEGWKGRATPTGPQTEEHTRDRRRTPESEEHWREPGTPADAWPQGGPPGTVATATGCEEKSQTEARSPPEGPWSNHNGKPPVVSKWEPATPLDCIPKELGRWDRKESHFVNEDVSPHRKHDPPKGVAIAKAVKHPKKRQKTSSPIEKETENSPDPKGDLTAVDQTVDPIEDSISLDPAGVTPSRRLWTIWEKRTRRNSAPPEEAGELMKADKERPQSPSKWRVNNQRTARQSTEDTLWSSRWGHEKTVPCQEAKR